MLKSASWCLLHNLICVVHFNSTALRKAKIVYNFGLSECNRVKDRILKKVRIWDSRNLLYLFSFKTRFPLLSNDAQYVNIFFKLLEYGGYFFSLQNNPKNLGPSS